MAVSSILALIVQVGLTIGLRMWGVTVARRQGGGLFWRIAAWTPIAAFAIALVGFALTIVGLFQSFSAVSSVDPSMKARLLAEGISTAMNATAISIALSGALYLASVITFLVGAVRAAKK